MEKNEVEVSFGLYVKNNNKEYDFISYNKSKITKGQFNEIDQPIYNPLFKLNNKPTGGLWASSYTPEKEYNSSWIEYLNKTKVPGKRPSTRAVLFNVKKDANIYCINSLEDFEKILYWFEITEELYEESYNFLNRNKEYLLKNSTKKDIDRHLKLLSDSELRNKFYGKQLNFLLLSTYFDGIYLTEEGAKELINNNIIDYTKERTNNLNSWGVESLLLFNCDCIEKQKEVRF